MGPPANSWCDPFLFFYAYASNCMLVALLFTLCEYHKALCRKPRGSMLLHLVYAVLVITGPIGIFVALFNFMHLSGQHPKDNEGYYL